MDNTLGRLRTRFDLTISGNIYNPVLFGDIEVIDGNVELQDRTFEVVHGRISFFNPAIIEPYINFQVETFIKDYRVTIKAEGLANRDLSGLDLDLTSSPPLPPEDVMTLISLGDSFQRTYHYDQSRSQGTASLLTFTLSEEAQKSAKRLFSIDQFRLDPYILGSSSEVAARLTVGKRLGRNFFIQYATNLSTERKDIVRMEFEVSRDLSIVGMRDENGRLSIDLKIHKRFR
jgi:autotransporter translocation and assembly factor TamB